MEFVLAAMTDRGMFATTKPQRSTWQRFLAPMLLVSLGLHGLILLVPTGPSQEEVMLPPGPEPDGVAITRMPPAVPLAPNAPSGEGGATVAPGQTPAGQTPIQRATPSAQRLATAGSVAPGHSGLNRRPSSAPAASAAVPSRQAGPQGANGANRPNPPNSNAGSGANSAPGSANNRASGGSASPSTAPASTALPASPAVPPTVSPSPPPSSQPLMGRELREQLQAYVATLNLPQTQVDRLVDSLRHRFRYDAVASADAVLPINQTQWQRLIRQETRMADLTPEPWPDPVSMVYRQRVCLAPDPGPVTLGVVTEADGSLRGDPAVLQSSGYGAVDDKARAALAEQDFPTAETIQAYILTVEPELDYGRRPCLDPNPDT